MLAGIMIRRRSDEDLSAITLNPSSVLISGEDVRAGGEPAEELPRERDGRSAGREPAHVGEKVSSPSPDRRHHPEQHW